MKKLFPGILALLMCFGCLTACGPTTGGSSSGDTGSTDNSTPADSTPAPQVHDADLRDVKNAALVPLADQNTFMNKAYTLINGFSFQGDSAVYDIAWSIADANGDLVDGVTITEGQAADTVTIAVDEDVQYILTATVTCPDGCCTLEYSLPARTASAAPVPVAITEAPVEGTAYKFYVYQGATSTDCFLTGGMKNTYYFETTPDYSESIDLYVKNVDGGFNLYHVVNNENVYINVVKSGTHTNAKYQTIAEVATPTVWTWNTEWETISTTLSDGTYYLGCDGTYDTVEPQYKTDDGYYMGYLCTMKDKSEVVITDEEKVTATVNELKVDTRFTLDKQLTLATKGSKYAEVAVTWAVEGTGATLTLNILELAIPTEAATVTLTATVTCGEVTEEKVFTIEVGPKSVEIEDKTDVAAILAAAQNLASGETLPGTYALTGEITSIDTPWDADYSNITVSFKVSEEITMKCYRLKSGDADASGLKVGDTITVSGSIMNYYGKLQFAQGCTLSAVTAGEDNTPTLTTPEEIVNAAWALAPGATLGEYTLTGVITEASAYDTTYNNVTVTIVVGDMTDKPIVCFRMKSGDADATNLKVGDTITVTGTLMNYSKDGTAPGTVEFNAGCKLNAVTPAEGGEGEEGGESTNPTDPVEPTTLTIAEALELGATKAHDTYTTEMYYVSGKIVEVQNTKYGNVVISDGTNSILVYGLYIDVADSDEDTRYDAMETKPLVGDTVKLLSVVGQYSNKAQLKNAFLVELTAATDADKVAIEKEALTLSETATGTIAITLPANGASRTDVAIAWEVTAGNEIATIADGKLNITNPTAETTVTVKATITCGESIDSKTFDIKVTPAVAGANVTLATFEFGANGATGHDDGSDVGTSKSYTENGYDLALTNASKVFSGAKDETGVSALKLGTSSVVGTFTFTVDEKVSKVVFYVAKYKAKTTKVSINGVEHEITTSSNDGSYTAIEIDTSTTKSITFATVSGACRCMIDKIEFVGSAA